MAKKVKTSALMDKILASNTIKGADILSQSKFFVEEFYDTQIPALNIALSARIDGGLSKGSTVIAGDSKTFKTMFMLRTVKSYMDAKPNAIFVFYDNEFGTNNDNFASVGIDTTRVIHKPITNIKELKDDIYQLAVDLTESEDIIIGIDSLGSIASKKEQDDALTGSEKADMTRAKQIKSFWRLINPYLNIKKIPLLAIGQTYDSQEFIPKTIIGGGTGMEYFPNNTWLITKSQVKTADKKTFLGSIFTVNVHKGRLTREKSQFKIRVLFDKGIDKYSALVDIAYNLGFIEKTKIGRKTAYYPIGKEELTMTEEDTSCREFWDDILSDQKFKDAVYDRYSLGSLTPIEDRPIMKEEE